MKNQTIKSSFQKDLNHSLITHQELTKNPSIIVILKVSKIYFESKNKNEPKEKEK